MRRGGEVNLRTITAAIPSHCREQIQPSKPSGLLGTEGNPDGTTVASSDRSCGAAGQSFIGGVDQFFRLFKTDTAVGD